MCNNVEEDGETHPVKFYKSSVAGRKCVKCDEPGVVITRIHDAFCKTCFQVYIIHKFRAAIGKSKLIREGEKVLVAFSGGNNSAALLHLIQDGLSERAHRKLRFIPTLLHIDECGILDIQEQERKSIRREVLQLMLHSNFPTHIVNLEEGLKITRQPLESSEAGPVESEQNEDRDLIICHVEEEASISGLPLASCSETERLKFVSRNLASITSQQDFLRNLRTQLIVTAARQLGFDKVLTADCSSRLAVRILTDVSQGRGSQLALNTAFSDARNGDVMFIRPVRDLNVKELAMYNSLFDVRSSFIPDITSTLSFGSSIERLTETFVMGLQADFPSTVSNIFRTSEKLDQPDTKNSIKCSFCQSPLDTNVGNASALRAVEFSQKLSQSTHVRFNSQAGANGAGNHTAGDASTCDGHGLTHEARHSCEDSHSGFTQDDVAKTLCYGCRLSLRNCSLAVEDFPSFITRAATAKARSKMKEQISEFLITDEEDHNGCLKDDHDSGR